MTQTTIKPRIHHVDGPMLPHLNHFSPGSSSRTKNGSTSSLVPILTPPIPRSSDDDIDDGNSPQYLLVPSPRRIVVRSAHHGRRVCALIPTAGDGDGAGADDAANIRAVALTRLPAARSLASGEESGDDDGGDSTDGDDDGSDVEWVILAACDDGVVREWSVSDLSRNGDSPSDDLPEGTSSLLPRRSFRTVAFGGNGSKEAKDLELIHMTSPSEPLASRRGGAVLYGLARETTAETKAAVNDESTTWLVRLEILPYVPQTRGRGKKKRLAATPLAEVRHVKSKILKEESSKADGIYIGRKDSIFGFAAARRPSSSSFDRNGMDYVDDDDDDQPASGGDVFVVMCASHGVIVYRDAATARTIDNNARREPSSIGSLVRFRLKSAQSQYETKEESSFCSLAISPGARDLAVGRANGHIEVLDNVFQNVSDHLDRVQRGAVGEEGHPEGTTVRRTVHWHSNPVRTLAFLAPGGAGGAFANRAVGDNVPTSLLSGGEESVLVTWDLSRNYHRPSNFVARVGHGGIVHVSACPRGGRAYVFCSDNSVGCYDGRDYERAWVVRGLASMALHPDDEGGHGGRRSEDEDDGHHRHRSPPKRGPIIMVEDPITDLPMLANLSGAPGMVHWYDAESASVVGTLEVAPYNRVSRRDAADAHVPAPAVTHLAVSEDGRDMVTVDAVWTENTSVGASHLVGGGTGTTSHPTAPMNVCTSIKFWSYVDGGDAKGGGGRSFDQRQQRKRAGGDVPMNYELVSSMAAPHGREGEVCSLALSPHGNVACTLSREEDAFRVWVKNTAVDSGGGLASTLWKCLYRVRTPSGYANLLSASGGLKSSGRENLISFSSDGTVLSVSYGPCVTLWDHTDATLLTSLTLGDSENTGEDIRTADFLTGDDDAMLLTSGGRIGVMSPFSGAPRSCYLGEDEWTYNAASDSLGGRDDATVSAVVPLPDFEGRGGQAGGGGAGSLAVATTANEGSKSIVRIFPRCPRGQYMCGDVANIQWEVDGEVQSLLCMERSRSGPKRFVRLLAVTKDCRMLSLSHGFDRHGAKKRRHTLMDARSHGDTWAHNAPVLKVGPGSAQQQPPAKRRKVSIGTSLRTKGDAINETVGFEFPALSGKFATAFIAQSLGLKRSI
eukprot:CAMPEP_0181114976 /NCGR_PEP_ID=MMETSP1071-20121207/21188_1 /TAXON_ID=35127 /ORGANISM="Thalassiosira sp., Strain NH16" /LENGTH=1123 /DNA_ID=CAMNT_0023199157 /DNA_START=98 /DNA_END=3469 /DNA_ORIENTATION=-